METKNKQKSKDNVNESFINIHDCLKLIGMKEVTANVYALPSRKKKEL
ncbi:hypothetical protein [Arcticibacterium luteifluviistationis]|nr:hypothetical protein [Arcticibacterium luteifluviistationis]